MFYRKFVSNRNERTQILMNKSVYIGLSILELSKAVMNEVWYDYVKPKFGSSSKLCYMDTENFIVRVKTNNDTYKNIAENVEKIPDT